MELSLINQELCESRLYRTTSNFRGLTGRDVANLAYLNTIVLYLMLQDDKQHDYAKNYAKQTVQYGNYDLFRTHATDLYMLCMMLANPDRKNIRMSDHSESKRFINSLNFDQSFHRRFLRKLSTASDAKNDALTYFIRLEAQLKISDGRYKRWRRYITDWGNLKFSARQQVVVKIKQEMHRLARGAELVSPLTTMVQYRGYKTASDYKAPRTSFTKRAVGTAVGAVAGRYAADKLNKADNKTAKNIGTGIGAIAGYWASGRQKQK
jgi:hypothetical protein